MSKKNKTVNASSSASASSQKTTAKYTPDTAPIIYNDNLVINGTSETKLKINSVESESTPKVTSTATIEETNGILLESEKSIPKKDPTKVKTYPESFYKTKISVRIIGETSYKSKTLLELGEVIDLVLNNCGKYSVITSEQSANSIIDCILNASNSELKTELSLESRKIRIERFKQDLRLFKH